MSTSYRVLDRRGRVRIIADEPERIADVAEPQRGSLQVTLQRLAEGLSDLQRRGA